MVQSEGVPAVRQKNDNNNSLHHTTAAVADDDTANVAPRPLRGSIAPTDPLKVMGFDNKQISRVNRTRGAEKEKLLRELMDLRARNIETFRSMSSEEKRAHKDRLRQNGILAPHSIVWD